MAGMIALMRLRVASLCLLVRRPQTAATNVHWTLITVGSATAVLPSALRRSGRPARLVQRRARPRPRREVTDVGAAGGQNAPKGGFGRPPEQFGNALGG